MFVETKPLPFFEVVPLRIPLACFRTKLVDDSLEFSPRTVEAVVIDLLEPWPDCRRRNDRVKHLGPPRPSIRPFAVSWVHDCDVVKILIVVIVVSDVEARGALR